MLELVNRQDRKNLAGITPQQAGRDWRCNYTLSNVGTFALWPRETLPPAVGF